MKHLFILFFLVSSLAAAQDIYIGDKINLSIQGSSEKEIREALKGWEIDSIKPSKDGYIISFRGYTPGEKTIDIGGKAVTIDIKYSLTPEEASKKDQEIYLNLTDNSNKNMELTSFPYLFTAGIIGALFSLWILIKSFRFKKEKLKTPAEKFEEGMKNLDTENWNFQISELLREYIDSIYSYRFQKGIYKETGAVTKEDIEFLKSLDTLKFSGGRDGADETGDREAAIKKAMSIYRRIKEGEKNV